MTIYTVLRFNTRLRARKSSRAVYVECALMPGATIEPGSESFE